MKYVLDSGVALEWVLPEADSLKANRLTTLPFPLMQESSHVPSDA